MGSGLGDRASGQWGKKTLTPTLSRKREREKKEASDPLSRLAGEGWGEGPIPEA